MAQYVLTKASRFMSPANPDNIYEKGNKIDEKDYKALSKDDQNLFEVVKENEPVKTAPDTTSGKENSKKTSGK